MESEIIKEFILTVKYLPDIELFEDKEGFIKNFPPIEVKEGPDGEIGLPGNLAKACGWNEGDMITAYFDKNHKLFFKKKVD